MTGQQDMGKRGAVRTNSGEPVDNSGPVLRIGPTTPVTAGRNPAACPPGFVSSQSKSWQESENGVLSGASGASDELRSGATQQISSLDLLEINRYTNAIKELRKRGRKRYCGSWSLRGGSPGGQEERVVRLDCKTWGCAYCGPRKAARYKQSIRVTAQRESLSRFLTLTLDPAHIEGDPVRYLRVTFNKFRVYLHRKYGCSPKYIAVLEFHQSGVPHLHILIDRFVPQAWISASWSALGGGRIVHIKYVDVHRIAHYLSKYLTKEMLLSAPERSRRVTTSRSIHLNETTTKDSKWIVDKRSIFYLFALINTNARQVHIDEEGFLLSFVVSIGFDTPFWRKHQSITTLTLGRIQMSALPCLLCGKELDQRSDKHDHPYFVCNPCGLQMFVRREQGIENLRHLISTLEERKLFLLEHSHVLFEIRAILEELDGVGHELEKLDTSTHILTKTPKTEKPSAAVAQEAHANASS